MMKDKDLVRFVTSLDGSEPPCTSLCSISDRRPEIEEFKVGKYSPNLSSSISSPNSSRQGLWQYQYDLPTGFISNDSKNDDSESQEREQILLRIREEFTKMNSDTKSLLSKHGGKEADEISAYSRVNKGRNILTNNKLHIGRKQLKTVSTTSSLRQFLINKTLKGKEIVSRSQEAGNGFGSIVMDQNDEKLGCLAEVACEAHVKSGADNDQSSSHEIVRSDIKNVTKGICLREWLKPGCRKVDKVESLLLFRQIVRMVDFAHSQGIVLQDLRPSCFILLPSNRIKYTGSSAMGKLKSVKHHDSNKKRPLEQIACDNHILKGKQMRPSESVKSLKYQPRNGNENEFCIPGQQYSGYNELQLRKHASIDSTLIARQQKPISPTSQLEENWYTSPEELNETGSTFSSNIYGLGVLLFELLCCSVSWEVHSAVMLDLRNRILPPNFLSANPKEAGFCIWLLHPEPSNRPTTREILQSEFICGSEELYSKEVFSKSADNMDEESEQLRSFLISLKEKMLMRASKLVEDIGCLEDDIKEVQRRHLSGAASYFSTENRKEDGLCTSFDASSQSFSVSDKDKASLTRNIDQLEDAYFSMRSQIRLTDTVSAARSDKDVLKNRNRWCHLRNENESPSLEKSSNDILGNFFEGLCKFACYNQFKVCGTLRNTDLFNSTNVICSLGFDRYEDHIAVAGVSKKIKIFEFGALSNDSSADIHYPVVEMSNKSKLSCVCWNPYIKNYLASTDYDGVVQMWDAGTGEGFSQYKEHNKRAWSVDFSQADPTKFASGSDDCSVKLWSINDKSSIGTIWNPANVCCVQFSNYSTNLLVFGSADYKIYGYDLRHTRIPWCTLAGHGKAVSYVKFLDAETLVSASTDNTLKLWDLNKTLSTGLSSNACYLSFTGHTNEKNFVGLSVLDGYIACGSETNEVYTYYRSLPMPVASHRFGSIDSVSGNEMGDDSGQFVSSVCWRRKSNMVVAANSTGSLKLLQLI
ncbi:protein SUPPRESSOR OF PHYA-105 1 isoform X1 [Ziziphus jujuba]|uniref:Protein SUPPRESSOR OF PHYA-105 1 isoform X1 n=1 Tax=Ziziphus jujuba TaxID=326968 RepID=A0ABM3IUW7_ZIZJJ|nr:protein SUPPRESSOR OF PHYA-105 1 isoform X1 [Ziziphus jujuba]